jgi:Tfp pilus assembly protein PilV
LKIVPRGISLLETVIALFILAVVGVAVVAAVFTGIKSNDVTRTQILGEGLARYELEYVKAISSNNWTGITAQIVPYTIPSAQGPLWDSAHNSLPEGYDGYSVVVTISALPSPYDSNMRKVNATVSYRGIQEVSIDTLMVHYP